MVYHNHKQEEGLTLTKKDEQHTGTKPTKSNNAGGPAPLSGSHKVKNRQHTRQKHNSHHDM